VEREQAEAYEKAKAALMQPAPLTFRPFARLAA